MAQLGMMAGTYRSPLLDEVLDAIVRDGCRAVQYAFPADGGDLPERIDDGMVARVRDACAARSLTLAAVAGTYNMAHPDPAARARGQERLQGMIRASAAPGAIVTLCTGTRDQTNMWRRHPDNDTAAAWADLVASMREAVRCAEQWGVTLAFEPEVNNVVDSARKARRLLDAIGSAALKVVMDPANLFHAGELPRMREVLDEAFALLGPDIALAHAKDLDHDGDAGHLPAGQGVLDYPYYLRLLQERGFAGALILHGLSESDVAGCVAFLHTAAPPGFW